MASSQEDLAKEWDELGPSKAINPSDHSQEDLQKEWDSTPAKPEKSTVDNLLGAANAFTRHNAQGLTMGYADEIGGHEQALLGRLTKNFPNLMEKIGFEGRYPQELGTHTEMYRQGRDDNREQDARAMAEHPVASTVGTVAGGLTAAGLTGAGSSVGWAGNAARAAAMGGMAGLGTSTADLTGRGGHLASPEQYQDAAQDTALGGVLGGGLSLIGSAIGGTVKWARDGLKGRVSNLRADNLSELNGRLGGVVQKANRVVENLDRNAPAMTRTQDDLQAILERDHMGPLKKQLIDANQAALPGLHGEILAAQQARDAAMRGGIAAGKPMNLLQKGKDVAAGAVQNWVSHAASGIGGAVGGYVGGYPGMMAGSAIGKGLVGASRSPAVMNGLQGLLAVPQKLGKFAQPLAEAYARGGQNSLAATHYALQADPEYREQLKQAGEVASNEP